MFFAHAYRDLLSAISHTSSTRYLVRVSHKIHCHCVRVTIVWINLSVWNFIFRYMFILCLINVVSEDPCLCVWIFYFDRSYLIHTQQAWYVIMKYDIVNKFPVVMMSEGGRNLSEKFFLALRKHSKTKCEIILYIPCI